MYDMNNGLSGKYTIKHFEQSRRLDTALYKDLPSYMFLEGSTLVMDKVVVRQAMPSDIADIVRISKGIYRGYDPLPGSYLICLENPNRCAQVAEWNGEVVSADIRNLNCSMYEASVV